MDVFGEVAAAHLELIAELGGHQRSLRALGRQLDVAVMVDADVVGVVETLQWGGQQRFDFFLGFGGVSFSFARIFNGISSWCCYIRRTLRLTGDQNHLNCQDQQNYILHDFKKNFFNERKTKVE